MISHWNTHTLIAVFGLCSLLATPRPGFAQEGPKKPAPSESEEFEEIEEIEEIDEDWQDEDDEDILPVITVETSALADRGAMSGSAQRVEQLDPKLLERRGATNLAEALEWLSAGSSASPTGTTQGLIIDGLPTSQVVVLRDGLPVTRPAGSQQGPIVDLSAIAINPQNIERIDIYRGSGPVGSGSAGGVIIDIITRRAEPGLTAFVRSQSASQPGTDWWFGQDLMGSVTWGKTKDISLGATAIYSESDAIDVNLDQKPDTAQRRRGGGELSWTWRPTSNDFLRMFVIANLSETTSKGGPQDIFDDIVDRQIFRLRAQGRWWVGQNLRLDHNLDLGKEENRFKKRVLSSGFERLKSDTEQENIQQVVTATWFTKKHDLAAEVYGRGWRIARTGETGVLPQVQQGEVGAGLADTFYPSDKLEFFARAVAEQSSAYGAGLNAQGSASVTAIPSVWVLRVTASSTRRVPTPEELYLDFDHSEVGYRITGNPELEPERLHSFQLSSVWNTKDKRFGLEAQTFVHQLQNTVIINTVSGGSDALFSYTNGGRARVIGGQLQTQLAKLVWDLNLIANYTYLPIANDLEVNERLPQRAKHAGRIELRRRFLKKKLELWTDASGRSSMTVPTGSPEAPGNVILGVGARYYLNQNFDIMLDANNLLNQTNVTWGPLPGRFLYLNLTWKAQKKLEETY